MALWDAIADRALSNRSMFFRKYRANAVDFQSPMFRTSLSVRPAAAKVVAPPIRNEWEEILAGSMPKCAPIRFRYCAKYGGLRVHCSAGIWKK